MLFVLLLLWYKIANLQVFVRLLVDNGVVGWLLGDGDWGESQLLKNKVGFLTPSSKRSLPSAL